MKRLGRLEDGLVLTLVTAWALSITLSPAPNVLQPGELAWRVGFPGVAIVYVGSMTVRALLDRARPTLVRMLVAVAWLGVAALLREGAIAQVAMLTGGACRQYGLHAPR